MPFGYVWSVSRPLRIEFAGALYHVTSRGDGQKDIYLDDPDRRGYLSVLSEVCKRFNWSVYAYCLMDNHYHLLIETPDGNLSRGMRQLNGVYTQCFNRHHKRVGHVFQGRYKAILVQKDAYLLELSRYIVLNPVRARMVRAAKDWPWSSYRVTCGVVESPDWLITGWLLSNFAKTKKTAIERYRQFVAQGKQQPSPWEYLKNQIFLGDEQFVEDLQGHINANQELSEIPKAQRRNVPKPLDYYENKYNDRNQGIIAAYHSGGYSMREVGTHFGMHCSSVSKILKQADDSQFKT
jgi:REP-associated tyrosine transposase